MEELENLWQQVNAQCCKEASLNDMSSWAEEDDVACPSQDND